MKSFDTVGRAVAHGGRALGIVALAALAACGRDGEGAEESRPSYVNVGVENVAVASRQPIQSGPVISGALRAQDEAAVRAQTGGAVVGVYVEEGQPVRRGQLLVRIEGTAAQQGLLSAQSAVRSAQQNHATAQRELDRVSKLVAAGALAERDLEAARNAVTGAQAQLAGARAQLAVAAKQLENTEVRAPISGVVAQRAVNGGDVVAPGAPLVTVVNPAGMRLEASVPSDQLGQVRVGAAVSFTVSGYPGRSFVGRVERISPAADPVTRQVPIFVAIPNAEGRLVSGLFAQGRVAAEARESLVVPLSAVDQNGSPSALRIRRGVVERVPVQLGIVDVDAEQAEVVSGLAAGDTVLTGAALGISPRTPVRVTGAPAAG